MNPEETLSLHKPNSNNNNDELQVKPNSDENNNKSQVKPNFNKNQVNYSLEDHSISTQ